MNCPVQLAGDLSGQGNGANLKSDQPKTVSAAELERMMKLQDVILKAMAKRITWMAAAEIAGVSDRTMRRMKERYEQFGYDGLFDQRRGKRSIHRIPLETAERVLAL